MTAFHTINGVVALLSGLGIVVLPKGSMLHRRTGYVYVAAMYVLCILSFGIRDTTPFIQGLGAFHVMALVSTATVTAGLVPVLRSPRRAGWYDRHFRFMLWSYVGLIMAFNSHFVRPLYLALRDLATPPAIAIVATGLLVWVLPFVAGWALIPGRGGQTGAWFRSPASDGGPGEGVPMSAAPAASTLPGPPVRLGSIAPDAPRARDVPSVGHGCFVTTCRTPGSAHASRSSGSRRISSWTAGSRTSSPTSVSILSAARSAGRAAALVVAPREDVVPWPAWAVAGAWADRPWLADDASCIPACSEECAALPLVCDRCSSPVRAECADPAVAPWPVRP